MRSKSNKPIKPYGRDWSSDRSAPDYDPQRDPWNPTSPVFGQWPRRTWLHDAVREPIWWAIFGWFFVTLGLLLLHYLGMISHATLLIGWVGKYGVLFGVVAIAGMWSLVVWWRKTSRGERRQAFRQALRRAPANIAWFTGFMAILIGLDVLEKRYGVPFLFSAPVVFIGLFAVGWWWQRGQKATR